MADVSPTLPVDAFAPLDTAQSAEQLTRPSLSYWQDAWRRLQANKRAMASLGIVMALLLFTLAGPLVWQVDPTALDPDQISIAPGADRSAMVVDEYQPWVPPAPSRATSPGSLNLAFAESPTTQSVRLVWQTPIDTNVFGYRIYRNIFPVGAERNFGLPLTETGNPFFEDRLDLKPSAYYYTVIGLNEFGEETDLFATISTTLVRAITVPEARLKGLLGTLESAATGTELELKSHPLGTDYLGRDMLSRLMYGARVSLFIGFFAPLLYVLVGVIYGSIAGFLGGSVDQLMMRFADFVVALPFLLFMILFKVVFGIGPGESGIMPMLIAMVVLLWPGTARLVRGQILQIREEAYVSASRLLGAPTGYLIFRHMVPNTLGVILVTVTFAVPSAIFTEAFLSFIGMGVAPPTPSWGAMCNEGIKTMLTHPHKIIFPAALISITVLAFNLLGDGLRDALDARMRNQD